MSREADNFLENILLFSRMLRQAGIPVSLDQSIDFARALTLVNIGDRDQVYHAARSLLVTRYEHLRLFETIFNRFWRAHPESGLAAGKKANNAARNPSGQRRIDIATYMAARAREVDEAVDVPDRSETYSPAERLRRREFSEMTPEELEKVKRLIREMQWQVSLRQTRRRIPDPRGRLLYLRRMMRSATKYGGVPLDLAWQSRKVKQRPFVLIADVSGSMEKYARLMLQFFYSVSHSLDDVECFVFGTRLTRITQALKLKNIDRAVDEAAREVVDWSGGTRIGESLRNFNREWSRRVLRRGAIVLVVSDGWERGDADLLKREMRYLHHRCHRLIWLNPLLGKSTYEPRVEGMSAALPYVDDFLPVHNLQSLHSLSEHLAALGKRRSPKPMLGA